MNSAGRLEAGLGIGVWILAIGLLDFSLEQAILVPALPAIQQEYGASPTAVIWLLTGFLVAAAVATPIAGRLGDRYGKRLVILWSLALFAAGSLVCALGDSIGVLIAGRVIQGLGAGVGPLAVTLARDHVSPDRVPRAVGILVGVAGVGGVLGFLAAGVLVDHVSVEAIFWFLFGLAVLVLAAVVLTVRESPLRASARVDWLGGLLLAGSLGILLLAVSQGNDWDWGSARELALFGGGALLAVLFWAWEQRTDQPLLDVGVLASRPVASANLAVFAVGYALLVAYAIIPLIGGLPKAVGYGLELSTTELAWVLTPSAVGALVGGLVSGRLVATAGARGTVAAGVLCGVLAYLGFVVFSETVAAITLLMIPVGFGTGLAIGATTDLVVLSAHEEEAGVTLGVTSVVRAIGSALGAGIAVAIFTGAPELAPGVPSESGFEDAFVMALIANVVALAAILLIPRPSDDPVMRATRSAQAPPAEPGEPASP